MIYSNQESHSESQGVHDNCEDDADLKDKSKTAGIAKSVDEGIYDGENIDHKTVLWFVFGIMHIYRRKSFKDLSIQDHTTRSRYSYFRC